MADIATVTVDVPGHTPFLCRWPQPYQSGDDSSDWYTSGTGQTSRKVQRNRLTDEVYWCQALVDRGAITAGNALVFDVVTGPSTSPAVGWSAPAIDKLGLIMTGVDGCTCRADFLDVTHQDIVRDGHVGRSVRRYVQMKVTAAGAGTQLVGDVILGVHVYLHFRPDAPNALEVDFLVNNGLGEIETDTAKIAARGAGLKVEFAPTSIGFTAFTFDAPTGWTASETDRPLLVDALPAASNAHCFPRRFAAARRYVLARTAPSGVLMANEIWSLLGLGRAEYVETKRSYHTVKAYGPAKSYIPHLGLGSGYTGGYAVAKVQCQTAGNSLRALAVSGAAGGIAAATPGDNTEFGIGPQTTGMASTRMGLFHPVGGTEFPGAADGHDVEVYCGARMHIREFVRHARLYSSMKLDGCAIFLFEKTTGRCLNGRAFADSYTGTPIGFMNDIGTTATGSVGQQPFPFESDQNSGGDYEALRQQHFAGWIPRTQSYPPHFWAGNGVGNDDDRWWPELPAGWGVPLRSLWSFTCDYRPKLEQIPVWNGGMQGGKPRYGNGNGGTYAHRESVPGTSISQYVWGEPEDDQHAIRTFTKLIPTCWLGGDLMAIDQLQCVAEYYGYRWTEIRTVNTGDTNLDNFCIPRRLGLAQSSPGNLPIQIGRGQAWIMAMQAAYYALSSVADRESGYSLNKGLKYRCEQLFLIALTNACPENGMTSKGSDPGGTASPYVGGGSGGTIPTTYAIFQSGLELPKVYYGWWSLLKQCESFLAANNLSLAKAIMLMGFDDYVARTSLYIFDGSGPSRGPANFVATWTTFSSSTGVPVVAGDDLALAAVLRGPPGSGSHWDDNTFIVELAYRITGQLTSFRPINSLGGQLPSNTAPSVKAASFLNSTCAYAPGLVALIQRTPGADTPFVAPSISPAVIGAASPNPVIQGDTLILFGQVFPGQNPPSTGITVTADLAALGGTNAEPLLDDGVSPDAVAGDNVFTLAWDTTPVTPAAYTITLTVTDAQLRQSTGSFPLTVVSQATSPTALVSVSPFPVEQGQALTIFADVTPGTSPASTGIVVTASVPFAGTVNLKDDGVAPDVTAADGRYTASVAVPAAQAPGDYSIRITVSDAEGRMYTASVLATVAAATPPTGVLTITVRLAETPIVPGGVVTIYGDVIEATSPPSLGIAVSADFSAVGGPSGTPALDDGVAPDVDAGDGRYSATFTTSGALAAGEYTIGMTVTDKQGGVDTDGIKLTVTATPPGATDPLLSPAASPNPIAQTGTTLLTATVTPGSGPPSTGILVTADLTAFGLGAAVPLLDDGIAPDASAGDNVFSVNLTLPTGQVPGVYTIDFSLIDDQLRTATGQIQLTVIPFVDPKGEANTYLTVIDENGTRNAVPLNPGERLYVYDETGAPFEIQSFPDVAASAGGQLPITLEDGISVEYVPFAVIQPPDGPDEPVPGPVVPGTPVGAERRARAQRARERGRG